MKKRSLFVATAMLLVAVLVATGATYAWFTTVDTAKANITMSVETGSSLEISTDGTNWKSIADITTGTWKDLSTTDAENFFEEVYKRDGEVQTAEIESFAAVTTNKPAGQKIFFRSTQPGTVVVTGSAITTTAGSSDLKAALRIGANPNTGASFIIANGATAYKAVGAAGAYTNYSYTDVTPKGITSANELVALSAQADANGYYTADVDFTFWAEGTQCDNGDLQNEASITGSTALTFTLKAPTTGN